MRSKARVSVRPVTTKRNGKEYHTFLCRWRENGKDCKKRFKKLDDAEAYALTKEIELGNDKASLNNVVTRLSMKQVQEAEAGFQALGDRYSMREAIDFFLSHYSRPDFEITIHDALKQCLADKEKNGVRARSLKQLESTVRQFEVFATIHNLKDGEHVVLESVRATLTSERAAMPEEIAKRMEKKHRARFLGSW